jgi:gamma-glutamyltranspeptidase/glutathione hydrolase
MSTSIEVHDDSTPLTSGSGIDGELQVTSSPSSSQGWDLAGPLRCLSRPAARWAAALGFLATLALAIVAVARANRNAGGDSGTQPVIIRGDGRLEYGSFAHGGVSTTHELATLAAAQTLARGGNAADAAVVAQFVLAVVQPQSTGLGGGLVALVAETRGTVTPNGGSPRGSVGGSWDGAETLSFIDGREEAPAAFSPWAFCADLACSLDPKCTACPAGPVPFFPDRCTGGHPIGIPGTVAAAARILAEHGTLSLAEALQPAIDTARNGFPLSDHLHTQILANTDRLLLFEASRDLFLRRDPVTQKWVPRVAAGETFTNPEVADTMELIAREGPEVLYGGSLGKEVVAAARNAVNPATQRGGLMTIDDLRGYRAVRRNVTRVPLDAAFAAGIDPSLAASTLAPGQRLELLGATMPSAGGTTLGLMVNLAQSWARAGHARAAAGSAAWFSALADIQNVAFADRNKYMGDADWVDVPIDGLLSRAYSDERTAALLSATGRATALPVAPGSPPGSTATSRRQGSMKVSKRHGTTHLSVMVRCRRTEKKKKKIDFF